MIGSCDVRGADGLLFSPVVSGGKERKILRRDRATAKSPPYSPLSGGGVVVALIASLSFAGCQKTSLTAAHDSSKTPPVIKTKTGVEMVQVPAGLFTMGSAKGGADERPPHKVWIDSFLIDRHEITQAEAEAYLYMTGLIIRLTIESVESGDS